MSQRSRFKENIEMENNFFKSDYLHNMLDELGMNISDVLPPTDVVDDHLSDTDEQEE